MRRRKWDDLCTRGLGGRCRGEAEISIGQLMAARGVGGWKEVGKVRPSSCSPPAPSDSASGPSCAGLLLRTLRRKVPWSPMVVSERAHLKQPTSKVTPSTLLSPTREAPFALSSHHYYRIRSAYITGWPIHPLRHPCPNLLLPQ